MSRSVITATLLGALAVAACDDLAAPDFNNPGIDELQENPSRAAVINAATGLLIGARDNISEFNGYVSLLGALGRESYNLRGDDARFVTELLIGPLNPGTPAIGGNLWARRYQNIRNANILLNAVATLPDVAMSTEDKESIRGFAKTIQAHDFLLVINTREANGAVIDADRPLAEDPAPIEDKATVFAHVVTLLDEAAGHLAGAGDAFPFPLSDGFAGFDTPETFMRFNRALMARVQTYMGSMAASGRGIDGSPDAYYQDALDALDASFVDASSPLDMGVYHTFGTGSGDEANGLLDPNLYAHPSLVADAEVRPGESCVDAEDLSCRDLRIGRKLARVASATVSGLESDLQFDPLYPSSSTPIPIIRNEELILLRAEANIGLGDYEQAEDDINLVRVNSGGLDPVEITADDALAEVLEQRRYSLLFEGGHRWIDLRRHGMLDLLPLEETSTGTTTVQERFPIPEPECLARGMSPPCSAASQ